MLYAYTKLKDRLSSLETVQSNCNDKQFNQYITKTEILMMDVYIYSRECIYLSMTSAYVFEEFNIRLKNIINRVKDITETENLVLLIEDFLELFTEEITTKLSKNDAPDRNGYDYQYPFVSHNIIFDRKSSILFYDCPSSVENNKLNDKTDLMETYGVYINYNNNCPRIDNVAYGVGGNSRISNNSFDVLICSSVGKSTCTGMGIRANIIREEEKEKIISASKYLANEGILQYMLPVFRIDHSFCMYMATNFTNFHVYRINSVYVEIHCTKKEKGLNYEDYHYLRNTVYDTYSIPYITSNELYIYTLPTEYVPIAHFRGSKITDQMLNGIKSASDCMDLLFKEQVTIKEKEQAQPLLPFNTGQIGLIMASGKLDGIVHEKEGGVHVIKGRVERNSSVISTEEGTETLEYSSIKINALTPSGKLIKIE